MQKLKMNYRVINWLDNAKAKDELMSYANRVTDGYAHRFNYL